MRNVKRLQKIFFFQSAFIIKVCTQENFRNNNRLLKDSCHGTHVKVEKCGIDLIYAKDDGLNHNTELRDHLEYFGDNGSAGETAIHNVKGRSEDQALTPIFRLHHRCMHQQHILCF